jgi:hypothetical protein
MFPRRIRTHSPRKREAADPRLRTCGLWDVLSLTIQNRKCYSKLKPLILSNPLLVVSVCAVEFRMECIIHGNRTLLDICSPVAAVLCIYNNVFLSYDICYSGYWKCRVP